MHQTQFSEKIPNGGVFPNPVKFFMDFEIRFKWTTLYQHMDMPRDSFQWQVHYQQSRTSSNLHQQRGQNFLDQWYQSTVSLKITSLVATGITKYCTNSGDERNSSRGV